jgi:hypothetical protein
MGYQRDESGEWDGLSQWDEVCRAVADRRAGRLLRMLLRRPAGVTVSEAAIVLAGFEHESLRARVAPSERLAVTSALTRRLLPQLEGADLVAWDRTTGRVEPTERAGDLPLFGGLGRGPVRSDGHPAADRHESAPSSGPAADDDVVTIDAAIADDRPDEVSDFVVRDVYDDSDDLDDPDDLDDQRERRDPTPSGPR